MPSIGASGSFERSDLAAMLATRASWNALAPMHLSTPCGSEAHGMTSGSVMSKFGLSLI
jgi:hypothetical protein